MLYVQVWYLHQPASSALTNLKTSSFLTNIYIKKVTNFIQKWKPRKYCKDTLLSKNWWRHTDKKVSNQHEVLHNIRQILLVMALLMHIGTYVISQTQFISTHHQRITTNRDTSSANRRPSAHIIRQSPPIGPHHPPITTHRHTFLVNHRPSAHIISQSLSIETHHHPITDHRCTLTANCSPSSFIIIQ